MVPAHVRNATHEYVVPFAFTVFCVPIVNPVAVRDWMRFAASAWALPRLFDTSPAIVDVRATPSPAAR